MALRCDPRTKRLSIRAIANEAAQLWRWYSSPQAAGAYLLESVMFPGYALSNQNGQMMLLPISMASYQYWYPVYPNIALAPAFKSVSTRVVPNTPLPPARIDFVNSHSDAIFVLLADVRASGQVETIRIPAGQRHQVMLDRDAGATIVETHEYLAPTVFGIDKSLPFRFHPRSTMTSASTMRFCSRSPSIGRARVPIRLKTSTINRRV